MAYDSSKLGLLHDSSYLIKDSLAAPGAFLLPQLLRFEIKGGQRVVLVLVGESLAHYQHVLRKLGITLQQHIDSRQVAVVDLLAGALQQGSSLDDVFHRVQEAAASIRAPDANTRILFDDLSELSMVCNGCEGKDWTRFLLKLLTLDADSQALALLVHADITEDAPWIRLLEHHIETTFQIDELESGHSIEVTGQIGVTVKEPRAAEAGTPGAFVPSQRHLYKLTDAGMRLLS